MILKHLYRPGVVIAHQLPVAASAPEGGFHRILEGYTAVRAAFTDEEAMTFLKLEPSPQLFSSLLLAAPNKRVQLVRLELPVIDEPASLLVPRPYTGHKSVVVELVENLPGGIQPHICLGRDNIIRRRPGLRERLYNVKRFFSTEETSKSSEIVMMVPHTL